ncbi:hypothetical protein BpHYR1_023924 [Brachionus plicatilis]|uniref:Uncharacterized protein n=1 Tax=Brachionus plicatilis TaxID=10195 RepID=A0A3M7S8V2_BRAPC|nr:hypothetical protein BpHYR1_023924 [Brachionus plicatilis]
MRTYQNFVTPLPQAANCPKSKGRKKKSEFKRRFHKRGKTLMRAREKERENQMASALAVLAKNKINRIKSKNNKTSWSFKYSKKKFARSGFIPLYTLGLSNAYTNRRLTEKKIAEYIN